MGIAAAWLLRTARGLTFAGDDIYYYARYVAHGFGAEPGNGVEYFLAPHNGHLQVGGKLIYRVLFEVFGADYTAFRVVNLIGLLLSVGLFYLLCRRRVGPLVALPPAVLLLFLGYAWEPLIWAFDMHTVYALAFGLGAVLALEREDRAGDVAACVLLVLSVSMIELGLAFAAGAAVYVLLGSDRWRRAWIFALPFLLYAAWWMWARKFDQSSISLLHIHLFPIDAFSALAAIMGSVTGLNPTGSGVSVVVTTVTPFGSALAVLAVLGVVWRVSRGPMPRTFWLFLTVALAYWLTIALGGREPDSSRYVLAGTALVFLIAADAVADMRIRIAAFAAVCLVVLLALPANIAKFYDGRRYQLNDAEATGTEYAMLELAKGRVEPGYAPGSDPEVVKAGGGVFVSLPAIDYFRASREFGSIAYSLDQVRSQPLLFRHVADVTLKDALGISLHRASPPRRDSSCSALSPASPKSPVYLKTKSGGLLLMPMTSRPARVSVSRFATEVVGAPVGTLEVGGWYLLRIPPDHDPQPWHVVVDAPTRACRVPG
ncbi:MAG TPA: hypothetical protein VF009_00435 [Solirubrobacterales bacterium]